MEILLAITGKKIFIRASLGVHCNILIKKRDRHISRAFRWTCDLTWTAFFNNEVSAFRIVIWLAINTFFLRRFYISQYPSLCER